MKEKHLHISAFDIYWDATSWKSREEKGGRFSLCCQLNICQQPLLTSSSFILFSWLLLGNCVFVQPTETSLLLISLSVSYSPSLANTYRRGNTHALPPHTVPSVQPNTSHSSVPRKLLTNSNSH